MFEVLPCTKGEKALKLLHAQKKRFDLIIADAEMVEIDIFKFIETVQTTVDIPIVLMSEMNKFAHARKAIECGVSDIICTPTVQELRVIWKLVRHIKLSPNGENTRNEDENGNERTISLKDDNDGNIRKKPRWRWTDELHEKFNFAVKQLGPEASSKKIIELMDVPNLAKLTGSGYLQTFRERVKEKGVTDWTQITSETIRNQMQGSKLRTQIERRQRSEQTEQSMSRFNMQSWNSGQSNVSIATSAPLTVNSNYMGQSLNHLNRNNLSIMSGVNSMDVPTRYPNHIKQNQTRNVFGLMQQSYSPAVNQTTNNISWMERNQLNMGQKYAPTDILPESSAAIAQTKNLLPLRNAYSLLNQLQSNATQTGRNGDYTLHNTASLSNWLGNNSANRVQISNAMWKNAANVIQNSNVTGHGSTIQGINNFGMMQNSNDVNQGQNCLNNFTGNIVNQNSNAMEFNSANQGVGDFEMIENNIVVQNEHAEAPYQGCNIFSDVNENSIGQNHDTMRNNSVIQNIGAIGMLQNHQISVNEYMGAQYQRQNGIDAPDVYAEVPHQGFYSFTDVNENNIGQNHNTVGNNSVIRNIDDVGVMQNHQIDINENMGGPYQGQSSTDVQNVYTEAPHQGYNVFTDVNEDVIGQSLNAMGNKSGAVGMMQNHQIGFDEYMGAPYRGQSSTGAPNGNFMDQNPNALVNSSAVQRNGVVGTMQSHSINENAYSGVTYQVQNSSNAIIGGEGVGSSEKAVNYDDFVSELLNLDAVGEEPNN